MLTASSQNAYLNNDVFFTPSHSMGRKGKSVVSSKLLISFEIPHQASVGNSTHVTMTMDSHSPFSCDHTPHTTQRHCFRTDITSQYEMQG